MASTYREMLESKLEKSDYWFVEDGDGWAVDIGESTVHLEACDDATVRASVGTGFELTPEIQVFANHLKGWNGTAHARIANYERGEDGTLVLSVRRDLSDNEAPENTARLVGGLNDVTREILQRIASGESPRSIVDRD